jgi:hypothetical protein
MARPSPYEPVVYFCALLARSDFTLREAESALAERFGEIELRCGPWRFTDTDYYAPQIGNDLLRSFVSFDRLGSPEDLPAAKLFTNALEERLAVASGHPRPLNIDPGYLGLAQMVLASAKPFAHRVPLSGGIHAQLEYLFRHGGASFLEWTFPEYRRAEVVDFFLRLRQHYKRMLATTKSER